MVSKDFLPGVAMGFLIGAVLIFFVALWLRVAPPDIIHRGYFEYKNKIYKVVLFDELQTPKKEGD